MNTCMKVLSHINISVLYFVWTLVLCIIIDTKYNVLFNITLYKKSNNLFKLYIYICWNALWGPLLVNKTSCILYVLSSSWRFEAMLSPYTTQSLENVDSCTTLNFSYTMFPTGTVVKSNCVWTILNNCRVFEHRMIMARSSN